MNSFTKIQIKYLFPILSIFSFGFSFAQENLSAENPKPFTLFSPSLLSEYIQIESVTGNERQAGEFLAETSRQNGLQVRILTDTVGAFNFVASLFPLESHKPNIIFLNHIDVVPPGELDKWKYPPFSGVIVNDTIWGRGVIDVKGMAVMQLLAISEFKKSIDLTDFPYNVSLLSVSQEESTSKMGAKKVVADYFDLLNPEVVFGEGGSGVSGILESDPDAKVFCISVAEKKALWLKLKVNFPSSGHGSIPPPNYANKIMVRALDELLRTERKITFSPTTERMFRELAKSEKGIRKFALTHIKTFKPFIKAAIRRDPIILATLTNTITITNIANPGNTINQIPQEIYVYLDCRLLPETDQDLFIAQILENFHKNKVEVEIENESGRALASETGKYYDDFRSSIESNFPDAKVVPILFPAYTDNNYFRQKGVPVYGINPVYLSKDLLESLHNVNERMAITDLEKGTHIYYDFLMRQVKSMVFATQSHN